MKTFRGFIAVCNAICIGMTMLPFHTFAVREVSASFSKTNITQLQQFLLGKSNDASTAYDLNKDGVLKAVDLTLMKRELVPTWTAADYSALCINEICASNDGCLTDSAGRTPDWLELYNSGTKALPLSGIGLSNGSKNMFKFMFPREAVIEPNGYVLVLCNKSVSVADGEYRAPFNISVLDGDTITLTHPDFGTLDAVTLPELVTDITYGRRIDGATAFERLTPTPGASNNGAERSGFVTQPEFSVPAGFYDDAFSLNLSAEPGCQIYYTTDGSDPTVSDTAQLYTGEIPIYDNTNDPNVYSAVEDITYVAPYYTAPTEPVEKGIVIRAAATDGNGNYSHVVTNSYFVNKTKDYYNSMKVISVTSDPDALFDSETGIYVNAGNSASYSARRDAERPCNIQVFDGGKAVYSEDVGIRLTGGASKRYAQKSMTFYARSDYGAKKMKYDFFDGKAVDADGFRITQFDKLTLRNGGQDFMDLHIRDDIAQELADGMEFSKQAKASCIVFLDGEFWGYYTMQEKQDEEYLESHYGISENNIDLIESGDFNVREVFEQTEGKYYDILTLFKFIKASDMSDQDNYQGICAQFDVNSLMDYIILQSFVCNWDSCINLNNLRLWRSKTIDTDNPYADGRWRLMLYDTDISSAISYSYDLLRHVSYSFDYINQMNTTSSNTPIPLLFYRLIENDTFAAAFYQRYTNLLDTQFNEATTAKVIDGWINQTKEAVMDTQARFGVTVNYDSSELILRHFYENRPAWALHQLNVLCGISDNWDDTDIPDIDPYCCGLCMTLEWDSVGGTGTVDFIDSDTVKITADTISIRSVLGYPMLYNKLELNGNYELQFTAYSDSTFSFTAEIETENYSSAFDSKVIVGTKPQTYTYRFNPTAESFGGNEDGQYAANLIFILESTGTLYLSDVSINTLS